MSGTGAGSETWWNGAVVYQIFTRSFQDSDGDGDGDIPGILARINHIDWLDVDAVWLSPVYPSPLCDAGYDVSDFTAVDPRFGTLADLDRLLRELHLRGRRLILDVVPNHTSDCHAWFAESRRSRTSGRRDWYIWADPAPDGGSPNNWLSRFGGSAWTWEEMTGQYYLHSFLSSQPDLNWRNPDVQAAFADVLRFWLRRGIDGFRIDASGVLIKDALLRDNPRNPEADDKTPPPSRFKPAFNDVRPETFDCLAALRAVIDAFPGRFMAGEADTATGRLARFYGSPERPGLHAPTNFSLLDSPWDARSVGATIDEYLNALPEHGVPNWVIGGHDKRRIVDRVGPAQARVAAMLLLSLPGTVFFYAGDEIGMPGVDVPPGQVRDPFEKRLPGYGLNRDPERAPMRWSDEPGAGFTRGRPWLPIGTGVAGCNVADQREDPQSMLHLYRALIRLRHETPALRNGSYEPMREQGETLLFTRSLGFERIVAALNLSSDRQQVILPAEGVVLVSTGLDRRGESVGPSVTLGPDEALLISLL